MIIEATLKSASQFSIFLKIQFQSMANEIVKICVSKPNLFFFPGEYYSGGVWGMISPPPIWVAIVTEKQKNFLLYNVLTSVLLVQLCFEHNCHHH